MKVTFENSGTRAPPSAIPPAEERTSPPKKSRPIPIPGRTPDGSGEAGTAPSTPSPNTSTTPEGPRPAPPHDGATRNGVEILSAYTPTGRLTFFALVTTHASHIVTDTIVGGQSTATWTEAGSFSLGAWYATFSGSVVDAPRAAQKPGVSGTTAAPPPSQWHSLQPFASLRRPLNDGFGSGLDLSVYSGFFLHGRALSGQPNGFQLELFIDVPGVGQYAIPIALKPQTGVYFFPYPEPDSTAGVEAGAGGHDRAETTPLWARAAWSYDRSHKVEKRFVATNVNSVGLGVFAPAVVGPFSCEVYAFGLYRERSNRRELRRNKREHEQWAGTTIVSFSILHAVEGRYTVRNEEDPPEDPGPPEDSTSSHSR